MSIEHRCKSSMGLPSVGLVNTGGVLKILQFSTNKSLYLAKDT